MAITAKTLNLNTVREIPNFQAYTALVIGVIAGTFAAIFVRLAQDNGLPSIMLGTGRLALAAIVLTPYVLRQHRAELTQLTRRDILIAALAGTFLAAHFILLAYALGQATVMVATVLVNTIPLWVALLEKFALKAILHRLVWISLCITLFGGTIIGIGSLIEADTSTNTDAIIQAEQVTESDQSAAILGGVMALTAAVMGAAYMITGCKARGRISLMPYIWLVYSFGGVAGLIGILITGTSLVGYAPEGYFWLMMLTLVPQLIGHSGFNYALGYLSATIVSISTQTIVVTASVVAFFIFHEIPTSVNIVGSIIIGVGVCVAIIGQTRPKPLNA